MTEQRQSRKKDLRVETNRQLKIKLNVYVVADVGEAKVLEVGATVAAHARVRLQDQVHRGRVTCRVQLYLHYPRVGPARGIARHVHDSHVLQNRVQQKKTW